MPRHTKAHLNVALAGFTALASGCGGGGSSGPNAMGVGGTAGVSGAAGLSGTPSVGGGSGTAGTTGAAGTTEAGGTNGGGGSGTTGTGGAAGATGGGPGVGGQGGNGAGTVTCSAPPPTGGSYTVDATGVTFTVNSGRMRVQVCQADIVRVAYATGMSIPNRASLAVNATWPTSSFCVTEAGGTVTITTARMKAKIATSTGLVSFTDSSDAGLTSEASKTVTAATVEGTPTNRVQAAWTSPADEGLFGLGQHQDGGINRKGWSHKMLNANTDINIPMLVSSKGYGILWDNASTTQFAGNARNNAQYSFDSEAGQMVDYYFFYGPSIDGVIAGYRAATGAAPMFPKWSYGLFQSKDHYQSSSELQAVADGYRMNNIPVDVIVQDWQYWSPAVWGSHLMDSSRYRDPAGLVNQLHMQNIHTMISIWPLYQTRANDVATVAGELDNFHALNAIGALYPTTTSGGTYHFYDTFNDQARTLVYQQAYDRLLGKYGWDAIWADNTEPQGYPEGVNVHAADTALGKGALNINAYPLEHNRAVYEGWRKVGPNGKRVYILTRSAFAGQQRYAAGCWSGDINASESVYANQIPAGLSFSLSGMPYWTTDIGGYFGTPSEELFTRWFQFGAFSSTFRIHGQAPKELYGSQWSAQGKSNMLVADQLRYRLMPYIYSLGWKVTSESYTIMRALVFDFQNDTKGYNIKDQFMFGPALLVSPVTAMGATSRSVYLPAGTWYDFWTGATAMGGSTVTAKAPLSQLPIFVRAGSIVPMGPMIQYATQSIDPLEIRVYKGQDGTFTLYEDENDTYGYETGKYSLITFTWNDAAGQLSIAARSGGYTGMPMTRTFNVVWVGANHGNGIGVTQTPDHVVQYDGSAVVVSAK